MRTALQSLLRFIFWPIAILTGLLIAASIALWLFFDPNHYKPQISTFLQNQTGLPLTIEGDMHFTLFPWIGIKAEKVNLQDLATVQELDLKIPLRELLARHLIIDSLGIKGANITLSKDQVGKMNWERYKTKSKTTKENSTSSSSIKTNQPFSLALREVNIKNTTVTFVDHQTQQTWIIDHLDLSGHYDSDHPTPLKVNLDFSLTPFKKEAILIGKTTLEGTILFREQKPIIDLKTKLSFDLPGTAWEHTDLHAQLKGDCNKQLTLNSLNAQSGKIKAAGNLTFPIAAKEPIVFSLNINDLDVDKFTSLSKKNKNSVKATPSSSSTVTKSSSTAAGRTIQGELTIDNLKYDQYRLTNIKTSLRKQAETLALSPLSATLYNGKLKASLIQTGANVIFKGSLTDLSVQALLHALDKPEKLSGQANIDFTLSQHANDDPSGVIKCQITNGTIYGIDVNYYLGIAQSLIKKQNNSVSNTKQTSFDMLSATLMLHDNIIDNNDLNITSRDFTAKAEGSVYLSNQTLAYKLQANNPQLAYPLAIRIKGPIQNPKIEPDLDVYLKKIADVEIKKQINKLLGKKDEASSENTPVEDLGSKVEKEIGRGLKKILKLP